MPDLISQPFQGNEAALSIQQLLQGMMNHVERLQSTVSTAYAQSAAPTVPPVSTEAPVLSIK
nr:hypothetical protein L204_04755 [Cryptococcus depauperatus CBS 7855]